MYFNLTETMDSKRNILENLVKRCNEEAEVLAELWDNASNGVLEATSEIASVLTKIEKLAESMTDDCNNADSSLLLESLSKDVFFVSDALVGYERVMRSAADRAVIEFPSIDDPLPPSVLSISSSNESSPNQNHPISISPTTTTTTNTNERSPREIGKKIASLARYRGRGKALSSACAQDRSHSVSSIPGHQQQQQSQRVPGIGRGMSVLAARRKLEESTQLSTSNGNLTGSSSNPNNGPSAVPPVVVQQSTKRKDSGAGAATAIFERVPGRVDHRGESSSCCAFTTNSSSSRSSESANSSSAESCNSPGDDTIVSTSSDSAVDIPTIPPGRLHFSADGSIHFSARQIVSPDEFYIEPLSSSLCTGENGAPGSGQSFPGYAELQQRLNSFYGNLENRVPLFDHGSTIVLCRPSSSANLHGVVRVGLPTTDYHHRGGDNMVLARCQVLSLRQTAVPITQFGFGSMEAEVMCVDFGFKCWVLASTIWKIYKAFCELPAATVCCRLFDVSPNREIGRGGGSAWSQEAIVRFRSMFQGQTPLEYRILVGYVMNKREPYKLVAYCYSGNHQVCVNKELVSAMLAKSLTEWDKAAVVAARRQLSATDFDNGSSPL